MSVSSRKIATLISTCTKYSDVWELLHASQRAYWPGLSWRSYYIDDSGDPGQAQTSFWTPLKVPPARSWSSNLLLALEALGAYDYVFLWLDDLILTAPVPDGLEAAVARSIEAADPDYLRLNPLSSMRARSSRQASGDLVRIDEGTPYRVSTVFSLWRLPVLRALLMHDESAWEFEVAGSRRSDRYAKFFVYPRDNISFANLVIQGQIYPPALSAVEVAGLRYQGARPVMGRLGVLKQHAKRVRSQVFRMLPTNIQGVIHQKYVLGNYKSRK